jgi:hypothetical protein
MLPLHLLKRLLISNIFLYDNDLVYAVEDDEALHVRRSGGL